MRKLLALLLLLGSSGVANAQTTCTSTLNETAVLSSFADNSTQGITARNLRDYVCSAVAGSVLSSVVNATTLNVTGNATVSGNTSLANLIAANTSLSALTVSGAATLSNGLTVTNDGIVVGSPLNGDLGAGSINVQIGVDTFVYTAVGPGGSSYRLQDTTQGVNSKDWDILTQSGQLLFRTASDNFSSATAWLTVSRSTFTPTTISFGGPNLTITQGGGVQVGTPNGGDKGLGTLNVSGFYYANNAQGVTCTAGTTSVATLAITAGIVTHC